MGRARVKENYEWELWPSISSRRNVEIYREGDAHGSLFERKILGNYEWELSVDYQWELSLRMMREREREREREGWKARRVNPTLPLMPSPNYGTRACKKGRGTRTVHSLRGKSSGIMTGNYPWINVWELWVGIMT